MAETRWRNEPRLCCFGSLRSHRKKVSGVRVRAVAGDKLSLPIGPMVASLLGSLRVWKMQAYDGKKEGRERLGHISGRERVAGTFLLSFFCSFVYLRLGVLGRC